VPNDRAFGAVPGKNKNRANTNKNAPKGWPRGRGVPATGARAHTGQDERSGLSGGFSKAEAVEPIRLGASERSRRGGNDWRARPIAAEVFVRAAGGTANLVPVAFVPRLLRSEFPPPHTVATSVRALDSLPLAVVAKVLTEIHQGKRAVIECLLSPGQKTASEAGRKR
jgi:hypothetical protein